MPGARHSKHSKAGRARGERYGRRPIRTRTPLPVLVVVSDDTATAPNYFRALHREVKQHVTIKVVSAHCEGASPGTVVQQACKEKRDFGKGRDAVWVLLDLEGDANRRQQTQVARRKAEQRGVRVALSIPCYEVWMLLHLEDTGEQFSDCRAVVSRVKQLWHQEFGEGFSSKAQADYAKIVPRRAQAAQRAELHWNNNDPARTEVFKVIRQIDAFQADMVIPAEPQGPRRQRHPCGASPRRANPGEREQ